MVRQKKDLLLALALTITASTVFGLGGLIIGTKAERNRNTDSASTVKIFKQGNHPKAMRIYNFNEQDDLFVEALKGNYSDEPNYISLPRHLDSIQGGYARQEEEARIKKLVGWK